MQKNFLFILTFFLLFALVFVISWFFVPFFNNQSKVISPLPDFLSRINNNQVTSLNFLLPIIDIYQDQKKVNKPTILAKSVFVYDITKDKILYSKNIDQRLPMASLTKVMTAIIALENSKKDNQYIVRKSSLIGENIMGLSEGEILTLEELLYGLMLPSGNDAAEVLADNFEGGRNGFIKAMNNKVKTLGLKNTNFTNPSGLQGDGDQFSTAYDLFVITRFAISNSPLFNTVVSTFQKEIPKTDTHKYFFLENETNLISSYPGVKGVKTGFTPEAGLCLITYLDYKGHRIIGILLGSNNRRQEMKDLLDYSLKIQGVTPPPHN